MAKPLDPAQRDQVSLAGTVTGTPTAEEERSRRSGNPVPPRQSPASATPAPPATTSTTTTTPAPTTTTSSQAPTSEPPSSAPPPAAASPVDQVIALVNEERAEKGCTPLAVDPRLTQAANAHSTDMSERNYFSHTTPDGTTFDQRIKAAGHPRPGAENIAHGQESAESVMEAWMSSPGHRANILNCKLAAIGVGLDTDGWYWTQDFSY